MTFDESHHTWSFWKIDSPLFIKVIRGYASSIVCKIIFRLLCLTSTGNVACKKLQQHSFFKNLAGSENGYNIGTASNAYTIKWSRPIMSNSHSFDGKWDPLSYGDWHSHFQRLNWLTYCNISVIFTRVFHRDHHHPRKKSLGTESSQREEGYPDDKNGRWRIFGVKYIYLYFLHMDGINILR